MEKYMDLALYFLKSQATISIIVAVLVVYVLRKTFFGPASKHEDVSFRGLENLDFIKTANSGKKKWAINEIRKRKKEGQYFPPYPNGWFAVIESEELKKSEVKESVICGKEIVIWRGESGTAYVAAAYCPHLGAHLAVEGAVTNGDCIQCPFHNWQFDGSKEGKLTCIPYSTKVIENVNLNMWQTFEANGFIFVWYHAEGAEPTYYPFVVKETETGYIQSRMDTTVFGHIQDIFENGADRAHFIPIHGSFFANGQSLLDTPVPFDLVSHSDWESNWKAETDDPSRAHETSVTILSRVVLFGKFRLAEVDILGKQYGPGIFVNWYNTFLGKVVVVLTATPIEPLNVRVMQRFYCTSWLLQPFAYILQYAHATQFARDVAIWNRKIDRASPPLPKEDQPIKSFRRYYSQFYSDNSPTAFESTK